MTYCDFKPKTLMLPTEQPIGVFDSGVGGLTVLKALRALMPYEDFLYFGDNARLPYGSKSENTIVHYTLKACQILVERGIKALVIACNTASSVALSSLARHHPELPVTGVIQPGAETAVEVTRNKQIVVLATAATVRTGAYQKSIHRLDPTTHVFAGACPLMVALAEEGLSEDPLADTVVKHYLVPIFREHAPDTLVLGCTHFPMLMRSIENTVNQLAAGLNISVVDAALATANATKIQLAGAQLTRKQADQKEGNIRFLVTDAPETFRTVAYHFLGVDLPLDQIEWVDQAC